MKTVELHNGINSNNICILFPTSTAYFCTSVCIIYYIIIYIVYLFWTVCLFQEMDDSDTDPRAHECFDRFTNLLIARGLFSWNDNENQLLNKLKGLVANIKWSPEEAVELFIALMARFESTSTNDRSNFLLWMLKMLHCIEINYITPSWTSQKGKTFIHLVQDTTVTNDELKKNLDDDREKTLDEILEEIRQDKLNQTDEKLLDDVKDIVSSVNKDLTSGNNSSQSGLKKDLLIICRAAKKVHFTPRLTQIVSLCLMALSKTGRLLQVGTGEGKSCIVAMFAAFRAMRGEKVDIMSSSPVLAERDMKEWAKFYKALNIRVDCNINKLDQKRLKKCFQSQVVYGTVEAFAGDWLRHHFQRQDIFGERKFQCAIVDEVDSLMLDKGHHVVYISSDMPALQHLNSLLAFIWATANQYCKIGKKITVGQKYLFHQVVLDNITDGKGINKSIILQMAEDTGVLPKGSVRYLDGNLNLSTEKTEIITVHQLVEFFKTAERKFPTCCFSLHCLNSNGTIEKLSTEHQRESEESQRIPLLLINGGFCQYLYYDDESVLKAAEEEVKRALHFTPCQLSKDKRNIYIPGFLSHQVNCNLRVWIENAFRAKSMENDHEYIIEAHGIVPVDYSCTGVVENFMEWSDGLHQFLEMKHGSKLSDMTVITNYMSNVGLLHKYKDQIYGISGTLGQQKETETLQKIYEGITTCQIPSFKRRKLFEVEGKIVNDEKKWIEKISNVVMTQANPTSYRGGRAILIICETINRAKLLHNALADKVPNKKLYINNNMDNRQIFKNKLEAGDVIVATNLAGRGTDLKISNCVNAAGGLFVVQTFLPKNARVEAQAFGRTARQGSPGSAQLIVCSSHLSGPLEVLVLVIKCLSSLENVTSRLQDLFRMQLRSNQKYPCTERFLKHILSRKSKSGMETAKEVRDNLVVQQLDSYLEHDIPMIKKKQDLFCKYMEVLDDVYKSSNNKPADSDLSALNEFWGMWLLTELNNKSSITDLKNSLTTDLDKARQKLKHQESPSLNLHHYTAFGNELQKAGRRAESIEMYTKAIQEDDCWAAIAFYNRAFASLTLQDRHQDPNCLNQALEDLKNALTSVELYCEQIETTHQYATQQINTGSDSLTGFYVHMIARYKVLLFLKGNINEAIKKVDRARETGGNVKVEASLTYFMILENFLPFVCPTEFVALIRSRDPLRIQQLISRPSFDVAGELRCLESLGLTHIYTLDTLFSLGGFFSKIHRTIHQAFN